MEATIELAGREMIVEYVFKITSYGCPQTGPSYTFELEILGLRFPKQHADVPELEMPEWLSGILNTYLAERDDVNEIIQRAALRARVLFRLKGSA